jgi:sugar lactone lactonase YvrE
MRAVRWFVGWGAVLAASWVPGWAQAQAPLSRIVGDVDAYVVARGLASPDGLAIHPTSRELYVTEEDAGRVSVIRNGVAIPVIGPSIAVAVNVSDRTVRPDREKTITTQSVLRNPEGIAFAPDGCLFVVEDAAQGRVLEFKPDAEGRYGPAHVIPVPLAPVAYAWEGVAVTSDGRLFVAGSSLENSDGLPSLMAGGVFMRDCDADWWLVDCGPAAGFSSVALSRDEDILVVGDEMVGGVTCWDSIRQCLMTDTTTPMPGVEGVVVLPDGAIAVAQESKPRAAGGAAGASGSAPGSGRVLRIDPTTGEIGTLAEGFSTIESVIVNPEKGTLYVSEDATGLVIELRPRRAFSSTEYLLRRTVQVAETKRGLSPKKAPPFIKGFFHRLGVGLRDETASVPTRVHKGSPDEDKDLTLEELGANIPMIAGKVKISPDQTPGQADPITEIVFVHMFPGEGLYSQEFSTPSLCLYAARHKSGKVVRTEPLIGMVADRYVDGRKAQRFGGGFVCVPIVSTSAVQEPDGVKLALAFLNLDTAPDLYLTLNVGKENSGILVTDGGGGSLMSAQADILETSADGTEVVNVFMTGVLPRRNDDTRWLKIGYQDYWTLVLPQGRIWLSHWVNKCMPQLAAELTGEPKVDRLAADPKAPAGTETSALKSPPPAERESEVPDDGIHEARLPLDAPPAAKSDADQNDRRTVSTFGKAQRGDRGAVSGVTTNLSNLLLSQVLAVWRNQTL